MLDDAINLVKYNLLLGKNLIDSCYIAEKRYGTPVKVLVVYFESEVNDESL